jgi:hypothetical protein
VVSGQELRQWGAGHQLLSQTHDEIAGAAITAVDGLAAGIAGEQDAALLE